MQCRVVRPLIVTSVLALMASVVPPGKAASAPRSTLASAPRPTLASAPGSTPASALRSTPAFPEAPVLPVSSLALAYVVVSVADMDQALGLWVNRFGMRIVRRREGHDPGLAALWGMAPDAIIDQVLLLTPGANQGGIHLVRFKLPGKAVRDGAAPTDLVPKSVDIFVREIHKRYDELTAAGYKFRSPVGTMQAGDQKFFEAHLSAQDGLNLVLVELDGKPELTSPEGYGVAPQIVLTTSDNVRESAFFQSLMGLSQVSQSRLDGPDVEKTIGLPKGAGLDIRILGDPANQYGRLEIVQYEGVQSRNLYPLAKPPARGMLSVTYLVSDLGAILARGHSLGVIDHGVMTSILGQGRMATATSPAGLRVDFLEVGH